MAEDDLQLRVRVEQARADQPQRVHGGFGMERPVRPEQPVVPLVGADRAGQRIARMQVERHVEVGDGLPERPVLRQVVVERAVGAAGLREAVHQRADEAELLDAARQLARRFIRVLHRQRREAREAIRALFDLGRENVVRLARHVNRTLHVADRLHGRRIERQDHDLDARGVHQAQALVLEVRQPRPELAPHVRAEHLRVRERGSDGEMFLERDLALHAFRFLFCES